MVKQSYSKSHSPGKKSHYCAKMRRLKGRKSNKIQHFYDFESKLSFFLLKKKCILESRDVISVNFCKILYILTFYGTDKTILLITISCYISKTTSELTLKTLMRLLSHDIICLDHLGDKGELASQTQIQSRHNPC